MIAAVKMVRKREEGEERYRKRSSQGQMELIAIYGIMEEASIIWVNIITILPPLVFKQVVLQDHLKVTL